MTLLAITDLTRMQHGNVCIAGYTPERRCVRPVFRKGGIAEAWLFDAHGVVAVRPFAAIDVAIAAHIPQPPHTEDHIIDPVYRVAGRLSMPQQQELLAAVVDPAVAAIFGAPIQTDAGWYVEAGQGTRSLGTVQPRAVEQVIYQQHDDRWEYTLVFIDQAGAHYRLGVVDLALRNSFDCLRSTHGVAPEEVARRCHAAIGTAQVFLRIGLSRGWVKHPDRCYLQITGVHTFPDYLKGKCFADFPRV
jgi:hypothetical protein